MKTCPKCKEEKLAEERSWNALSRRDNKTYICSDCGLAEALEDALGDNLDKWVTPNGE